MGRAEMSTIWSRLLATTWILVAVAHGFISVASRRTGKPLWWVDNQGVVNATTPVLAGGLVYAAMLLAFIVAVRRSAMAPHVSGAVSIGLAASALIDLSGAPGSAFVSLAVCGAALLASIASLAGRPNRRSVA